MKPIIPVAVMFAALGVCAISQAATYSYVAPTQSIADPVKVGEFTATSSDSNIPIGSQISSNHFMGNIDEGATITKVFSFKHSVPKSVNGIIASVDYSGSNFVSTRISCTPPTSLTSAVADEICDLYITYEGYSLTFDPEFFTINLKGLASSTEYVDGSFLFSASVGGAGTPTGAASLEFQRTNRDINSSSLIIGDVPESNISPVSRTIVVTNNGTAQATAISVTLSDASKFSLDSDTCSNSSVDINQSCSFQLTFNPSVTDVIDTYFSSVSVAYNSGVQSEVISSAITGSIFNNSSDVVYLPTAEDPNPANYAFNWAKISADGFRTPTKSITVKNNGNSSIDIYPDLSLSADQYYKSNNLYTILESSCGTAPDRRLEYDGKTETQSLVEVSAGVPISLGPQQSCTISILFEPYFTELQAGASGQAPLYIKDSTGSIIATTSLTGVVSPVQGARLVRGPSVSPNPIQVSFDPTQTAYNSTQFSFELVNVGDSSSINTIASVNSPDFRLEYSDCGDAVYPGSISSLQSCNVTLQFDPASEVNGSSYSANVVVASNNAPSVVVPVQGTVSGITPVSTMSIGFARDLLATRIYNFNPDTGTYDTEQAIGPSTLFNYNFNGLNGLSGGNILYVSFDGNEKVTINSVTVTPGIGQAFGIVPSSNPYDVSGPPECLAGVPARERERTVSDFYGADYYYAQPTLACVVGVGFAPGSAQMPFSTSYSYTVTINATTSRGVALTASKFVSGNWESGDQLLKY